MTEKCFVLPVLPFCERSCGFHMVANVALFIEHPLIIVNGTKDPAPGVLRLRQSPEQPPLSRAVHDANTQKLDVGTRPVG